MKVSKAATFWIDYHRTHSKKNTVRSYQPIIDRFCQDFGDLKKPDIIYFALSPQTARVSFGSLPNEMKIVAT